MSAARPQRWVVATGNPGKLREIRGILHDIPFALAGLSELAPVDFPEEGDDYAANAEHKARAAAAQLGEWCVADDSGLEVAALSGAPGPRSARYGAPELDDRGRTAHLLAALRGVEDAERGARFVCFAALATPEGQVWIERGVCEGAILAAPRGQGGFGYDPVFRPANRTETMAELEEGEKNRVSHRARAFRKLVDRVRPLIDPVRSPAGRGEPRRSS